LKHEASSRGRRQAAGHPWWLGVRSAPRYAFAKSLGVAVLLTILFFIGVGSVRVRGVVPPPSEAVLLNGADLQRSLWARQNSGWRVSDPKPRFKGTVYFITPGTKPAEIGRFARERLFYVGSLNVRKQPSFPGVADRVKWFAITYDSKFTTKAADQFEFRVVSDHAILWVDDMLVVGDDTLAVDHDGPDKVVSKSGRISLGKGEHRIRVAYLHGEGPEIALQLYVTTSEAEEQVFEGN